MRGWETCPPDCFCRLCCVCARPEVLAGEWYTMTRCVVSHSNPDVPWYLQTGGDGGAQDAAGLHRDFKEPPARGPLIICLHILI